MALSQGMTGRAAKEAAAEANAVTATRARELWATWGEADKLVTAMEAPGAGAMAAGARQAVVEVAGPAWAAMAATAAGLK